MHFESIDLKDMSWSILQFIEDKEPMKASDIAEQMGLATRQVDAVITKSLVRYGFAVRRAHLTKVMKKAFNLISITEEGKKFVKWRQEKEANK